MTLLLHDSPRNCVISWGIAAKSEGSADAVVLNPWASRWSESSTPSYLVRDRASELQQRGVDVWFDPMTHVLQMDGVGDFRYYAEYDLWDSPARDLNTQGERRDHIRRVFRIQDQLGSPHLAPTVLLHAGLSATSALALACAEDAIDEDNQCWLAIAGTPTFWGSPDLDAHIGALAQLQPSGWFLSVARPTVTLPSGATNQEVFGMCRTARALSEYCPVFVPYGDLAALPAVAAGAVGVGTGWDQQQRNCGYTNFESRGPIGGGGVWYKRPTFSALFGSLTTNEALNLEARDPGLYLRLGPPAVLDTKEAFLHHAQVLASSIRAIVAESSYANRYRYLVHRYEEALANWALVQGAIRTSLGANDWIDELLAGLRAYGAVEGF